MPRLTVCLAVSNVCATAHTRVIRLHHANRERHAHSRIKRVAAGLQDIRADAGSEVVGGGDDANLLCLIHATSVPALVVHTVYVVLTVMEWIRRGVDMALLVGVMLVGLLYNGANDSRELRQITRSR